MNVHNFTVDDVIAAKRELRCKLYYADSDSVPVGQFLFCPSPEFVIINPQDMAKFREVCAQAGLDPVHLRDRPVAAEDKKWRIVSQTVTTTVVESALAVFHRQWFLQILAHSGEVPANLLTPEAK